MIKCRANQWSTNARITVECALRAAGGSPCPVPLTERRAPFSIAIHFQNRVSSAI